MKKVKLPRKKKKLFITLKANGRFKYWLNCDKIRKGEKGTFDPLSRGVMNWGYKYIPGVGIRSRGKKELEPYYQILNEMEI